MTHVSKTILSLALLTIFFITSACGLLSIPNSTATSVVPQQGSTQTAPPADATLPPTQSDPPTTTAVPDTNNTSTATPTTAADESAYSGFVVFQPVQSEFQTYDLNGVLLSRSSAPGFQDFTHDQVDVVGNNIYYVSHDDEQIYRSNQSGVQAVSNLSAVKPFGFKISLDEKQIAWSVVDWSSNPASSELWVGRLDGSDARKIATYNSDQSPAFVFIPIEWTADGKLLFNRTPTGFGGYILYGGYNSLYSYDPTVQKLVTYVPAEELHGLCLDSYRIDLNIAIFNCDQQGSQIVMRNLNDANTTPLPILPGYPISGSARLSPDGTWLAYAAAKGNPDAEGGILLVQPADLSAASTSIANVDGGYFVVQTWLTSDTILVTRNTTAGGSILFKINRSGQGQQDLAQGWFVAMTP